MQDSWCRSRGRATLQLTVASISVQRGQQQLGGVPAPDLPPSVQLQYPASSSYEPSLPAIHAAFYAAPHCTGPGGGAGGHGRQMPRATAAAMDACYVPNNPAHFGLEAWPSDSLQPPGSSADFALPPLELEPLPSLFQFSPCSGAYNVTLRDVLLSLKHAVVHPGQMSPSSAALASPYAGATLQAPPHSASLSYTMHPAAQHHQMLSPTGGYGSQYCGGASDVGYAAPPPQPPPQHAAMFPSMSVNVSMNMTMGYNVNMPDHQMPCPQ
ncbi:hypothetical protein B566_EDAN016606, partial [Ephemera danica]